MEKKIKSKIEKLVKQIDWSYANKKVVGKINEIIDYLNSQSQPEEYAERIRIKGEIKGLNELATQKLKEVGSAKLVKDTPEGAIIHIIDDYLNGKPRLLDMKSKIGLAYLKADLTKILFELSNEEKKELKHHIVGGRCARCELPVAECFNKKCSIKLKDKKE